MIGDNFAIRLMCREMRHGGIWPARRGRREERDNCHDASAAIYSRAAGDWRVPDEQRFIVNAALEGASSWPWRQWRQRPHRARRACRIWRNDDGSADALNVRVSEARGDMRDVIDDNINGSLE